MADAAATYGRGEAYAYDRAGIDPRASSPTPAGASFHTGQWRIAGFGPGGRWAVHPGTWANSPPLALKQDPHVIWNTPVQNRPEAQPYIRWVIAPWDVARTYNAGDVASLPPSISALVRSLRDDNTGVDPGTAVVSFGNVTTSSDLNLLNTDWWQIVPFEFGGAKWSRNVGHANLNLPGVTNLFRQYAAAHGAWFDSPIETDPVGANQWASGECQADVIGPVVRANPATKTYYRATTHYTYNPEYDPEPTPIAAQNVYISIDKVVNGVRTTLATFGPFWESWCLKLAVHTDAQGRAVLRLWWRLWGYDPFERDLDLYPWIYAGQYVDASSPILTGQPGYECLSLDGMYWWGWGEMGGPVADTSSYMLAGASRLSAPILPDAGDLAFSSPVYNVDDGTSDSVSITDSNSVSIISPASAGATDVTSSADSSTCRLIIPASVAAPFLLAVALSVAVLYDTATADTGSSSDSVSIAQPTTQADTSTGADLSVIGLGVLFSDVTSGSETASAVVGRFSATGDSNTGSDSVGTTLSLQSITADAGSESDSVACELIFPATIDVSDTTSEADGTAIIAAIGQSDASAQSDIAYGYLGQFATGSDATTSTDGVGTSITTGVWVPPAKAPRIKLALGGPVIRLRSAAPEIDISHAGGPLIRLSLLEER